MSAVRPPLKIAVLISGNGSNLQALIDHIKDKKLNAKIECVVSDHPNAFGLTRAKREGITTYCIDYKTKTKQESEDVLHTYLSMFSLDYIVLAGFMRILSPKFVSSFSKKILNIHPSLLPRYKGLNTHQRVLDAHEKNHGATVHFVDEELDNGPIILQEKIKILPSDTTSKLKGRVQQVEYRLYTEALNLLHQKI